MWSSSLFCASWDQLESKRQTLPSISAMLKHTHMLFFFVSLNNMLNSYWVPLLAGTSNMYLVCVCIIFLCCRWIVQLYLRGNWYKSLNRLMTVWRDDPLLTWGCTFVVLYLRRLTKKTVIVTLSDWSACQHSIVFSYAPLYSWGFCKQNKLFEYVFGQTKHFVCAQGK